MDGQGTLLIEGHKTVALSIAVLARSIIFTVLFDVL